MTNRLSAYIINELKSNYRVTSIANKLNISTHIINRIFDHIQYFNNTLPEVLSIYQILTRTTAVGLFPYFHFLGFSDKVKRATTYLP